MDIQSIKNRFGIIGNSTALSYALQVAAQVSNTDLTVLIIGESGVGKEAFAHIIHALSTRKHNAFIAVNCGAIPEGTIDSELFGHEKGSFTGAVDGRKGYFETVSGGTIFLDEIGEMSPALQAKLLRVTQDGRFQRVGSNAEIQTNARILAATNLNLDEQVSQGRFREDLFYRLNVVELNIPPLRERPEDILAFAQHFLQQLTQGRARLSASVVECLERYSWPGNVRELHNAMERAALLSRGELILPDHLPGRVRTSTQQTPAADPRRLDEIEHQAILQTLRKHEFNRTETARALGISRRALIYKLQRLRELGQAVDPEQ